MTHSIDEILIVSFRGRPEKGECWMVESNFYINNGVECRAVPFYFLKVIEARHFRNVYY